MALTPAEKSAEVRRKIEEAQRLAKSRETQLKIETSQERREERKLTPERRRQIEAAERSTRVRAQQVQSRASKSSAAEFRGQLKSGYGARTETDKSGTLTRKAPPTEGKSFTDRLTGEIGTIDPEKGASEEQKKAIQAIEEFNKRFDMQQEQDQAKSEAQLKRGDFTGGTPAQELFGGTESPGGISASIGELPDEAPDIYQQQGMLAEDVLGTEMDVAIANQTAKETLREQELRGSLSKLSLGDEQGNILEALEGNLGRLSLPQLEALAQQNGLELTDDLKDSLTRDGKAAIEREQITKKQRLAENEYSKKQLSRQFNRAITDREEFNTQQDARLRRLAASFGGGKFESMSANVSIMQAAEKGQKAIEDLRSEFTDKTMLVSSQADTIIDTYNNNVGIIEGEMSDVLENKYAEITNNIDDLLTQGVTNELELNNSILKAKKDYMNTYFEVSEKAFEAIEKQNQQFFDNTIKLRDLRLKEQKERQTNRFVNSFGSGYSSTPTSDTTSMTPLGRGEPFIRDDGTQGLLGENCVKYCRTQVSNLPWGLNTKADKQRAVDEFGFRDPGAVKVGDAVLTAEGDVGHAAIIVGIEGNNIILEEANYQANQITRGRKIDVFDSNIYGFIPSENMPPQQIGGNISLEGTNEAIQSQTNQAEFVPKTPLDREALAYASGEQSISDMKNRGFSEDEINTVVQRSRSLEGKIPEPTIRLDPKETFRFTRDLKKDFESIAKEPKQALVQIGLIRKAFDKAKNDFDQGKSINAVSQGILVPFQKMLDPTSVVRESEYARSGDGQALIQQLEGKFQKLSKGGAGVTFEGLKEFVETAELFMGGYEDAIVDASVPIINSADRFGLDKDEILSPKVMELIQKKQTQNLTPDQLVKQTGLSPSARAIAKALIEVRGFDVLGAIDSQGLDATEKYLLSLRVQ